MRGLREGEPRIGSGLKYEAALNGVLLCGVLSPTVVAKKTPMRGRLNARCCNIALTSRAGFLTPEPAALLLRSRVLRKSCPLKGIAAELSTGNQVTKQGLVYDQMVLPTGEMVEPLEFMKF